MPTNRKPQDPVALSEEQAEILSWSYRKDHGFLEYAEEDEPDEVGAGDLLDWIQESLNKRQCLDYDDDEESDELPRYKRRGGKSSSDSNVSPKPSRRSSISSEKQPFSIPAIQRRIKAQAGRTVIPIKSLMVPIELFDVSNDVESDLSGLSGPFQCVILTSATGLRIRKQKSGRKRSRVDLESSDLHNILQIYDGNASLVATLQNLHEKLPEIGQTIVESLAYASYVDILSMQASVDSSVDHTPSLNISIGLPQSSLLESTSQVVSAASQREIASLRDIFSWIYPDVILSTINSSQQDFSQKFTPSILYDAIRPSVQNFGAALDNGDDLDLPNLSSKLRPYQQRAVRWLIHRENRSGHPIAHSTEAEAFWVSFCALDGTEFYFDQYSGNLATTPSPMCSDVKGGILSDEMGLGKTVEVISLVLSHKRSPDDLTELGKTSSRIDQDPEQDTPQLDQVRCYCGDDNPVDEELDFVQCESCLSWQHMKCVAFDAKRESHRAYICPECSAKSDAIDIGATLIVCPDTILSQWEEEITKHTTPGSLKVLVYGGVRALGRNRALRPVQFADYDIVLTTYNVLREELAHLNAVWTNERVSRMKKKYRSLPSPLTGCRWWRLAIDESQKIGEGTAGAAQMASTLQAVNRWAVSGTPIQRGLEDLYGLLLFLRLAPYSDRTWWMRAMQPLYYACDEGATARLHSLLRRIMWRNSKADVEAELALPPRTDLVQHLKFAEVEEYLYKKRRDECEFKISSIVDKCGGDISRISQSDMKKLINSLLRLRQVCCHPQLGSRTGFQSLQKCTMSMTQLLDQLVVRARVECEESQRLVIMNSHGLAAIYIIDKEFLKAATIYRDVLGPKEIEVDILQRIHALHNLAEVEEISADIDGKKNSVLFQAELSRIKEQESELRRQFMTRQFSRVAESSHQMGVILRDIDAEDMLPALSSADDAWWHESIERLVAVRNSDFLPRTRDVLGQEAAGAGLKSIAERFRDLRGMDFTIMTEMDRLLKSRNEALAALAQIVSKPGDDERLLHPLLEETMRCSKCHRRKNNELVEDEANVRKASVCTYCKVEDFILEYEKCLYVFKTQRVNQLNFEEEGLNKIDSELERLLRMLGSYVSNTPLGAAMFGAGLIGKEKPSDIRDRLNQQCEDQMRLFALFKKELKAARTQWRAQYDYLMAVDELQMCDFRVRLRFEGENVPEEEEHAKIHPYEVPILRNRFQMDKTSYEMQYRQHVSQLRYLERLSEKERSAQTLSEGTICPICQEAMKDEIVMFQCGHEVCPGCMMKILERVKSHAGTIKCPNCRARMNADEATYITRTKSGGSATREAAASEVKGSWGTKIESVVVTLSKIFENDPDAKVLIFSQWIDILMLVGRALEQNSISFLQMQGDKKKIKRILDKFKHDPSIRCLGLSFGKGADGLNLTEASHIILVEPTMNPSAEQQAIGRIHRIGQTKPTTVTRLIVEQTIEVNVYNLGQKRAAAQEGDLGSTSGYGARQRESEIFSLDELSALLDSGNSSSFTLGGASDDEIPSDEARQITLNAQYWNALVLVNNRVVPRNIALGSIQRQVYYALRERGVNLEQLESAFVEFKGKRLAPEVVSEIQKLKELEDQQEAE